MRAKALLVIGIAVAPLVLAAWLLPWWAFPIALVAFGWVGKWIVGKALTRFGTALFGAKGAVLRKAHVRGIALRPVPAPDLGDLLDDEERADAAGRRYVALDLEITPGESTRPFGLWEPGELRVSESAAADDVASDVFLLRGVEIFENGAFRPDAGEKFEGAQRVRLTIGCRSDAAKGVLRYYLESLGSIDFGAAA